MSLLIVGLGVVLMAVPFVLMVMDASIAIWRRDEPLLQRAARLSLIEEISMVFFGIGFLIALVGAVLFVIGR